MLNVSRLNRKIGVPRRLVTVGVFTLLIKICVKMQVTGLAFGDKIIFFWGGPSPLHHTPSTPTAPPPSLLTSQIRHCKQLNWCDAVAELITCSEHPDMYNTPPRFRLFEAGDNQLCSRWTRTRSSSSTTDIAVPSMWIDISGVVHLRLVRSLFPMIGEKKTVVAYSQEATLSGCLTLF